jgi:hypothetical protein
MTVTLTLSFFMGFVVSAATGAFLVPGFGN